MRDPHELIEASHPRPTAPGRRLVSIDILRGFALFGVLLVNMLLFAYPGFLYPPLLAPGLSALDRAAEWFIRVFAQASFYTIFAFLFGLGFALQMRRLKERGGAVVYLRRLFVLFAFGALHSILLWTGDILMTYALVGFFLLFFGEVRGRWLFAWGLLGLGLSLWLFWSPVDFTQMFDLPTESRAEMIRSYGEGSYLEVTETRVIDTVNRFFGTLYGLPRFLAIFMLGLWVGRSRLIENAASHLALFRWAIALGLIVGLAGKVPWAYDLLTGNLGDELSRIVRALALNISGPAIGVVYLSTLLIILQKPLWQRRLTFLAPVGRMALTNYLMQSAICTTIFYGYGFGLYGQVGPALSIPLAVLIFGLQIPLSAWWLKHFRHGPMEWLRLEPLGSSG